MHTRAHRQKRLGYSLLMNSAGVHFCENEKDHERTTRTQRIHVVYVRSSMCDKLNITSSDNGVTVNTGN